MEISPENGESLGSLLVNFVWVVIIVHILFPVGWGDLDLKECGRVVARSS